MVIYIDVLIILNYVFDYLLLWMVKMVLKRNTSNRRIFLASLFGEISIVLLLYDYNYIVLFISKLLIAILMCIIAFKYQSIKYKLMEIS